MKVNGINYINEAINYARKELSKHESPLSQELSDLVYGISLVYGDLKEIRPDIDQAEPLIQKNVEELTHTTIAPKTAQVARGVLSTSPAREGLQGIPNYGTNCFAISAYQLVKHNPALYKAIFKSEGFKSDPRFASLREFDKKYDAGTLTVHDMQKVRTQLLTQFGISSSDQQDPYEALTSAFFEHIPADSPLYFELESSRILEFTAPPETVGMILRDIEGAEEVSREELPTGDVKVQIRQPLPKSSQLGLEVSLSGVAPGTAIEKIIRKDLSSGSDELQTLPSGTRAIEVRREGSFDLPRQMMITLKRFDSNRNKISTPIDVPGGKISSGAANYDVQGFIVHRGSTIHSGHIVEYQKIGPQQWVLNNDSLSTPISEEAALRAMQDAYVLFAERSSP